MATQLRTTHEIVKNRHRVMISVLFNSPILGDYETQSIVIYSGEDSQLAETLAKEAAEEVLSGGVRVIRDGVEEP
jgi:hypothetical protein